MGSGGGRAWACVTISRNVGAVSDRPRVAEDVDPYKMKIKFWEVLRLKKTTVIIIALAIVTAILAALVCVSASRDAAIKEHCVGAVFNGVKVLARETENIASRGEYGLQSRENIADALSMIEGAVTVMNHYGLTRNSFSANLFDLSRVLGMWSGQINNFDAQSIPHDGVISDGEKEFLLQLNSDLDALLAPMLAKDGLNMRRGLKWSDFRDELEAFCETYSTWNPAYAPFDLLNN